MSREERKRRIRPFRNMAKDSAKFIESIANAYNPDAEFAPKLIESPIRKFFAALTREKNEGRRKAFPDLVESARIIEINLFGAYRVRSIESSNDLREAYTKSKVNSDLVKRIVESGVKLREASSITPDERSEFARISETAKFREDWDIAPNTNTSGSANPFDEFIPIMGGPFNHQLYLHDMLDALAKSFEAWNHNPLAHQIVKITTQFVLGRGVTSKARDPLVQDRWDAWWAANDIDSRLEYWSDMLSRDGELMIRKFKNPAVKSMSVRWVDPSTIWEIVTDAEDIERVFYYHQQYPTAYQVLYGAGGDQKSKFNPSNFESSKYIINQIPAAEIIHIKINCSPNEKRGRSDLFPILGWLKMYKDFQTGVVLKAIVQSTFAWKNKLKGTDVDVDSFISEFGTDQPVFGSVWVENEASDLTPMTPDTSQGGTTADCPGIINMCAVGAGIPKEYLGLSEHGSRATAVVGTEPGVKKFQARQLTIARLLKRLSEDWYAMEIAQGTIPRTQPTKEADKDYPVIVRWMAKHEKAHPLIVGAAKKLLESFAAGNTALFEPTDGEIEFEFPEIAAEDRTAKIGDLETALQSKVLSHRRYSNSVAKELGIEGYDYDTEKTEIAEDGIDSMFPLYAPKDPNAPQADGNEEEDAPKPKVANLSGDEKRDIKRSHS